LVSTNVFAGQRALQLTGFQRHSRQLPGWQFKIVRRPRVTVGGKPSREFRYLRLAWRSSGKGVMIELAAGGHWPPPNKPTRRYFSGRNTTKWKAIEVSPISPPGWTVVTLDLWKDTGEFELTGIAPTSLGGTAFFDRIELLRSLGQ